MGRNRTWNRRMIGAAALLSLCVMMGGCASGNSAVKEDLIGLVPDSGDQRVAVTITGQMPLGHFAAAVEERYPDIRLIQDSYMGSFRVNEHMARVEHGDLGDLVMVKAGHIPKANLSGLLMDLSTQAFPANYNASSLQMDEEGHIYLLPGPLSFNCNIYNKTLFEENGWEVPKTYDGFLDLCREIDKSGIRGYRTVFHDSSLQSFQIYNYCVRSALDTLTQVEGQAWHNKLMAGEKVPLDPMDLAFQDLKRMMDAGLVRGEDLEFTGNMRNEAFIGREMAVTSGAVDLLKKYNEAGPDEFCFMPHFSMADGQGWLLSLGYYVGANQELRRPGNEKKLEAAMQILDFMSSEEGQMLLIEDDFGMIPATRGAKLPDEPYMKDIRAQIESGRYIMRPVYDMFTSVLETEIAAFIRGEATSSQILEKCSRLLKEGAPPPQALGQAAEDFTVLQTGNLKADSLRAAAGADIALIGMEEAGCYVPVGGTRSKLYKGPVTEADVMRIAQIETDVPLMCSTAPFSGREVLALLEHGAASEEEQETGAVSHFHPFAVSGLTLTYSLGSEEGHRTSGVKLGDNKELDPDAIYTVAFLDGALTEAQAGGQSGTGLSMTDVFREYIISEETVAPDSQRIRFR